MLAPAGQFMANDSMRPPAAQSAPSDMEATTAVRYVGANCMAATAGLVNRLYSISPPTMLRLTVTVNPQRAMIDKLGSALCLVFSLISHHLELSFQLGDKSGEEPRWNRTQLSRELCERWNWRNEAGRPTQPVGDSDKFQNRCGSKVLQKPKGEFGQGTSQRFRRSIAVYSGNWRVPAGSVMAMSRIVCRRRLKVDDFCRMESGRVTGKERPAKIVRRPCLIPGDVYVGSIRSFMR